MEFPDGLGGDRIVEHTFVGPLDQQLRDALRYLQNSVISETVTKMPDRAESLRHFNYPFAALEEALANAVYHKGYDVREPIEVRVLPDRIEVLSYPGADRSVSREGLRHFRAISRRYRNRRVGDFLKELRLTEGRNTGFHKILRALRENGSPDPVFETDEDRLYFLTTIFAHEPAPSSSVENGGAGSAAAETSCPDIPLSRRQKEILRFFAENPTATLSEASVALRIPKATLSRETAKLRKRGALRRIGNNRTGSWSVD